MRLWGRSTGVWWSVTGGFCYWGGMDVAVPPTSLLPHMSTPSCVATQLLLCVVHTWEECLLIEFPFAALHYICSPVVAPVCLLLGRAAPLERETTWASCLACPPSSRHLHFLYSHQHPITVFLSSVPSTLCLPSAPLTASLDMLLLYSSCAHERQSCANARRLREAMLHGGTWCAPAQLLLHA